MCTKKKGIRSGAFSSLCVRETALAQFALTIGRDICEAECFFRLIGDGSSLAFSSETVYNGNMCLQKAEVLDFQGLPLIFVSNLLLVQWKNHYCNSSMVSFNWFTVLWL
ncbi:MAG: hypothetical protein K5855_08435, partial [Oscillospiraceae bacterium]|nr:hypothetical protein [Oscillospiraceae bacterium]